VTGRYDSLGPRRGHAKANEANGGSGSAQANGGNGSVQASPPQMLTPPWRDGMLSDRGTVHSPPLILLALFSRGTANASAAMEPGSLAKFRWKNAIREGVSGRALTRARPYCEVRDG